MTLVAEYELQCEALPLVDVAGAVPEATLSVRMVPHANGHSPFLVTVEADDPASVERAFECSGFVAESTLIDRDGATSRYQVLPAVGLEAQLGDHLDDLTELRSLSATEAIVERIQVTPTGWVQTARFADRAAFEEFRSFWQRNTTFQLRRLTRGASADRPADALTDRQRDALATAHAMGYFEIPRDATLEEIADELDISPPALSERLRRAQDRLLDDVLRHQRPGSARRASRGGDGEGSGPGDEGHAAGADDAGTDRSVGDPPRPT